jgi:hypothetical protein
MKETLHFKLSDEKLRKIAEMDYDGSQEEMIDMISIAAELLAARQALAAIQTTLGSISGIVSERHGDDGNYEIPVDDENDEPEVATIKMIFDALDKLDNELPDWNLPLPPQGGEAK